MVGSRTFLFLLIFFTSKCEQYDLDIGLAAPQASAWETDEDLEIDVTTFNGDISFLADPAKRVETEIIKRCPGGEAREARFAAGEPASALKASGRYLSSEPGSSSSPGCEYGADFDIKGPDSISLDLENANGNISVNGLAADVKLATTNGDILAENFKGSIEGRSTNGDIECEMAVFDDTQSITLSSTNGDTTLRLPADVSAVFDASAITGEVIISGFDQLKLNLDEPSHKSGKIGSGIGRISIQSTNGDVKISPC